MADRRPTKREWEAAVAYVKDLQVALLLEEREITVMPDPAEDGDHAVTFFPEDGWGRSDIHYGPSYWGLAPAQKQRVNVHEFGHIVLRPYVACATALCKQLGMFGIFIEKPFEYVEHSIVEWFEAAIGPHMPPYPEE